MFADELTVQGARPWTALVMTQFAQSNPRGLNLSTILMAKPSICLSNLLYETCNFSLLMFKNSLGMHLQSSDDMPLHIK